MSALPKWTEEREGSLKKIVGAESPVSIVTVGKAAESLETSTRSISSKLRKMGFEVVSTASVEAKKYSPAEEAELKSFLEANPNKYTYAEIAAAVLKGSKSAKQIQGKILSMELYGLVKETPKKEVVKKFNDAEEKIILGMVRAGDFIEDIAKAMKREVPVIRGKILSMSRAFPDISIPKQRVYVSKDKTDAIEALGDISELTVEDISEKIEKTTRSVKSMLTHRGLDCKNHNGSAKAKKIAEKKAS